MINRPHFRDRFREVELLESVGEILDWFFKHFESPSVYLLTKGGIYGFTNHMTCRKYWMPNSLTTTKQF
jgi:hypothetical protein